MIDTVIDMLKDIGMTLMWVIAMYGVFSIQLTDWLLIGHVIEWVITTINFPSYNDPNHPKLGFSLFMQMMVLSYLHHVYTRRKQAKQNGQPTDGTKPPETM